MKLTHISIVCLLSIFFVNLDAAPDKNRVGKLTINDIKNTHCPYDSAAGAYYIYSYGKTGLSSQLMIEFTHVVRLKFVDKSELDRANVTIPFGNKWPVQRLKGYTYNKVNGKLEVTELKKENMFKEKVNDEYSNLKLTFPNVKEGSVIEYSYTVAYGNIRSLNTWFFQTSIPVLHSEYHVLIPEYFVYQKIMDGFIGLDVAQVENESMTWGDETISLQYHQYIATKVPAYEEEAFSPAETDNISKIGFELRAVNVPGRIYETYLPSSYGKLAQKLMKSEYWNQEINNAPWAKDALQQIVSDTADALTNAKHIYDYIKNFKKSEESSNNLKTAFRDKKGTDTELNRMLIAVLRQAEYDAVPVRIATYNHGRVNPFYPMNKNFNFTIARLTIDDKEYLLDASEEDHQFGFLPKYCVNGRGLVIHEGPEEWVDLTPSKLNRKIFQAKLKLDEDNLLVGELAIKHSGYKGMAFGRTMEDMGEEKYL